MHNPLLQHYPAAQGCHDELFGPGQEPRPHWRAMLAQLQSEAPELMPKRLQTVQRQVRENGVAYNVYSDAQGSHRPWSLDVLPLILPAAEWAGIEAAVAQRATLLNRILGDLYGPQTLLHEGLLPPGVLFANPGFQRPCHGVPQPDDVALHCYAVDLARSPDGRWWVVGDRTQAPSGAGYALENRHIISRAFPELFRELKVADLSGFFGTLRDSLEHWGRECAARGAARGLGGSALGANQTPLMVLLTPGPYNETYFEQSYLARHLGFPLVEGVDLTVRNGMVWLKTLSGLQRVHVILRRLDDEFCDPLELRPDSTIGVPGLTEAARRGNVVVANGLGSNLLESGALLGFLPSLCRRLLGQELRMPSVATWWCGEAAALEDAVWHLNELVIKPAFRHGGGAPVFGADLDGKARDAQVARMRLHPQNYIAQELVRISQAPVWRGGPEAGLSACSVGLRVYACATPNGYAVMPGGLTRAATGADARVINMQRGGSSKDTWVLTAGKTRPASPQHHPSTGKDLNSGDSHLSSRVVEHFFWYGRYAERCEDLVRLTRTALELRLRADEERGAEWPSVVALCRQFGLLGLADGGPGVGPGTPAGAPDLLLPDDRVEQALIRSATQPSVPGLAGSLQNLFNVAFHLRERLSLDNWRKLNQMAPQPDPDAAPPPLADALVALEDTTAALMTLTGFALDGMTRDEGWRFLSIGRWIERLQFHVSTLQAALEMPPETGMEWLLELADSIITYRSRYMAKPEWLPLLDLLLLDETNTRSVVFQLRGLLKYLNRLTASHGPCGADILQPLMDELRAMRPGPELERGSAPLADFLQRTREASNTIAGLLEMRFFSYTGDARKKMARI